MQRVRGFWAVVTAFILSVAVLLVLSFAPMVSSAGYVVAAAPDGGQEQIGGRPEISHQSLAAADGWGAVARIAGPLLVLTGLPLFARSRRGAIVLRASAAALLSAGVVVGALSFGVFYLPGAVLLLVATAMALLSPDAG